MLKSILLNTVHEGVYILNLHENGYYFLYMVELKGNFQFIKVSEIPESGTTAPSETYDYLSSLIRQIYSEDYETRKCALIELHLNAA